MTPQSFYLMGVEDSTQAIVVRHHDGELIPAAGVEHVLLGSRQSQVRLSVEHFTVPPAVLAQWLTFTAATTSAFTCCRGS